LQGFELTLNARAQAVPDATGREDLAAALTRRLLLLQLHFSTAHGDLADHLQWCSYLIMRQHPQHILFYTPSPLRAKAPGMAAMLRTAARAYART